MEKAREMRRNGTRFPPGKRLPKASGHKLISALDGGDVDFSERPKREKLGASSHQGRATSSNEDSEMGGGSEGEEELRPPASSRRVKLNGKAFDECNAVDPASVPRKLRSAMSKRSRESISPPLPDAKKHHASNGADWSVLNCARKSKQILKAGSMDKSPKRAPSSSITKDEEEVVEALYALACISTCDKPSKIKGDRKSTMAKSAPLPEIRASSLPLQEASKEEKEEIEKLPDLSVVTVASTLASSRDESPDNTKVESEKEPTPTLPEPPNALGPEKLNVESQGALNDVKTISLLPKNEYKENPQLNECVNFLNPMGVSSNSYSGRRLLNPLQAEDPAVNKINNGAWAAVTASTNQSEAQPVKENCESSTRFTHVEEGPDLWPGMPGRSSDSQCLSNQLFRSKNSALWPDSANYASRAVSSGNDVLMAKLPPVLVDKRPSWKRCATQVYISRLIHGYQGSEKKNKWALPLPTNPSKPNDEAMQAVSASVTELPSLKTGTNSIVSLGTNVLAVEKNPQEARVGMRQDNRLLQDQHASGTSSCYGQHKQRCDFLSLLPGRGAGLEPSARSQVSYLQSLVQHQPHHPVIPFSLPHARYSSPYPDQIAAATAQQLPQYLPSHLYSPHLVQSSSISKQQQQQQQQQQQNQLWAAQLAQYRSSNIASPDLSKWPSGRQESSPVIPPTTTSAMDASGGIKYQTTNQQQLFANLPSRGTRPLHTGSYEEGGVGFRSDAPPPHLQLLCNAQHM